MNNKLRECNGKWWDRVNTGHYQYDEDETWEIHHNMPNRWDVVWWNTPENEECLASAKTLREAMAIASEWIDRVRITAEVHQIFDMGDAT